MNTQSDISSISSLLSEWYKNNKRDLPWRNTTDPYLIWLSEIILQQTRVEQGFPYFESIINRFPDVHKLAAAPLDELLKLWQGLGYYSRARNMHTAARQVVNEFGGKFPESYVGLLQLKGIGEYTAAAVASFAYHIPKAVLDGNVFRVLARLFVIDTPINTSMGKKLFSQIADDLLDRKRPDIHNQAIMEFGAIQCTPAKPDCSRCPLSIHCLAFATGKVQDFPFKLASARKQNRFFNYFFLSDGRSTWIQQRTQKDIWQQLWEFPLIESLQEETLETLLCQEDVSTWVGNNAQVTGSVSLRHILTHQIIHAKFFSIKIEQKSCYPAYWKKIPISELNQYAVSRLIDLFINNNVYLYL